MSGIHHYRRIAAKSDRSDNAKWLPFTVHSKDTAAVAELLFCNWLSDSQRYYIASHLFPDTDIDTGTEQSVDFCRLLALLHDTGKLTPAFAGKIAGNIYGYSDRLMSVGISLDRLADASRSPHNIAGETILNYFGFPETISVIIGSHHGRAYSSYEDDMKNHSYNYFGYHNINEKEWTQMWREWIDYSINAAGFSSIDELPSPDIKCQMLLTGLLIMSDWIASNTEYFPLIDVDIYELDEDELSRRAESAWERLGLPLCWSAKCGCDISELFIERFGFEPNEVQRLFSEAVRDNEGAGIYILEAPMGIGKTEAALAGAELLAQKHGLGGIYFGLPTQATANGLFGRIRAWAEQQCDGESRTIRLAHGMTDLNEEYRSLFRGTAAAPEDGGVIVHEWFEGRKQALLADFVTATVDQFLLASLKQRHVMLRHLGLSGKAVIIDECHAYDAYMNVYLDKTLTWMGAYGVPVIILSATLPPQRRDELIGSYLKKRKIAYSHSDADENTYPVLTYTSGNEVIRKALGGGQEIRETEIDTIGEAELASVLKERLAGGGCAAVIVNTVAYAQSLSRELALQLEGFEVKCFHSRFTAPDRAEIERELLKRVGKGSVREERDGLVVVATQVIEQSLDLDFDYMATELCPMDLLLQRSGRLHRHKRERPERLKAARLSVLSPAEGKQGSIYSKWILDRTEKYLPQKLNVPECIPYLVRMTYAEPETDEERESGEWYEYQRVISDKKLKAQGYCINSQFINSKQNNTLPYFLDDDCGRDNYRKAEASVRDGDETIEVLVMQKSGEGEISFLPWYMGGASVNIYDVPSEAEAIAIARSRLRLPARLCRPYNFKRTCDELKNIPGRWKESKWLKEELLLLLDDELEAEVSGIRLRYSREIGLEII